MRDPSDEINTGNSYLCTCAGCGSRDSLSMHAQRNDHNTMIGWIWLCQLCQHQVLALKCRENDDAMSSSMLTQSAQEMIARLQKILEEMNAVNEDYHNALYSGAVHMALNGAQQYIEAAIRGITIASITPKS